MQENYERLCERQVESIAIESALAVFTERDLKDRSFDDDSSDQESFVSATDVSLTHIFKSFCRENWLYKYCFLDI